MPPVTNRLDLSVQYASRAPWVPERPQLRAWVRAALVGGGQITVRFVDDVEGRELNRDYRSKDYPTNVLSFPYDTVPRVVGDLAVCPAVAAREAAEQGKSSEAHLAHLIVHGILHLQGFDHEDDAAAKLMEDRERVVLAGLGYADPYAGE
jgi:probable rRNA maturation factor